MSSYKPDGGRIPRFRDVASQSRNVSSSPMSSASAKPLGSAASQPSRSQIARPINPSFRSSRASSLSEAENSRPVGFLSRPSGFLPNHGAHPKLPPRSTTHPLPVASHPPPSPALAPERHVQVPYTETSPIPGGTVQHSPVPRRPRNVLRRKAPTIGQHSGAFKPTMESARPEKLNVIIPASPPPVFRPMVYSNASGSSSELNKHNISPEVAPDMVEGGSHQFPPLQGPKELASLRTSVNTHNLPPPTPVFHSASSPSTRYSGSPGVWSRTSTPTSLSSYSPGIVQPVKPGTRLRQPSPSQSRLPVFSPPLMQQSPQSDRMDRTGPTPDPSSDTGSITTVIGKPEEPESKTRISRIPSVGSRNMPSKPTTKSSLPQKANTSDAKSSYATNENTVTGNSRGRPTGRSGSESAQPPSRPSREGTHRLELGPSPMVVKSSLSPGTVTHHKRRGSAGSSLAGDRPHLASNLSAATSVDSLHSKSSSRIPSRMQGSPELQRKSPRTLTKEPKSPHQSTSPAKSRRFGLFTKKSKPDLDPQSPEETRPTRKGPAAGTGHEGYGRYATRGRKTSVGSSGSTTRARSTSTTRSVPKSVSSKGSGRGKQDAELDDFLLHRLEPVVIQGGGMDGATLMRTQSEQSSGSLSTASSYPRVSQSTGYSTESLATSAGVSAGIGEGHQYKTSQTSHSSAPSVASIPAVTEPNRDATLMAASRPVQHYDNGASTKPAETNPPSLKKPTGSKSHQKKSPRKGLGLKWPFFHRDTSAENNQPEPPMPAHQLQATVAPVAVHRPVAHYALVDADSDPLEDIIHNLEDSPPTDIEDLSPTTVEVPAALKIRKASDSVLLPSPPKLQGEFFGGPPSPKVYFNRDPVPPHPQHMTEDGRPTRLASVGRIPRVVSRRERKHTPAFQSFSRPFSVVDSPSVPAPAPAQGATHHFSPRSPPNFQPKGPGFPPGQQRGVRFDLTQPFGDPMDRNVLDIITGSYANKEFLTFSPGKESMQSSSGSDSLAAVTAVVPKPGAALNEDEVWGEFDDFIDDVLSPEQPVPMNPADADEDEKFGPATVASRALQAELSGDANKRVVYTTAEQPTVALTPASPHSSNGSIHLRRSRIVSALHSSIAPSSQPSYSDIIASYQDRHDDRSLTGKDEYSNISTEPLTDSQSSFLRSPSLNPSPSFETCRQRNTVLFDIAERDREGPTAQTNIRSGSLMTSRWLSFGRVLFSPAHNHVKSGGDQERILVIDGLGNDDWSFYCSLTYPNADVYILNEGPSPTGPKHPAAWMPPSNHHTIHHTSLEDQLPFPRSYFTVAVLRFPAASPDIVQNNIVSECKRVLRPGGYMEMSILDLDMVNMGIRTRKAVRRLKERTYLSDPNISLKPASDNLQRLLGRYGFDNLRRCMVRIPVAGMIVRTSASSSSTASSTNPPSTLAATTATPLTNFSAASTSSITMQQKAHGKSSSNDTDLSLGDLLSDPSPSPSNDESIRKIVAKVGRWWYTRCYEIPVLPNGDADLSIWADRKVIRECQQRGTGFRLLIAYAQKPSEKRRTASV